MLRLSQTFTTEHRQRVSRETAAASEQAMAAAVSDNLSQRFEQNGFAVLDGLTTADDIARLRSLLDPLFDNFSSLGPRAVDLAGPLVPGQAPKSPEINEAAVIEPRLRETLTYQRCRDVARHLLGVPVGYQFDHAIYKPPSNKAATAWHQDEAYNKEPIPLRSIHFWIPLQAATEQNGCMWFIPGSHLTGLRKHGFATRRGNGGTLAVEPFDSSNAVACPLAIGGVTIHHPLTLHYTGANESEGFRRAWILHFGAYGKIRHKLHPKKLAARLRALVPGNNNQ